MLEIDAVNRQQIFVGIQVTDELQRGDHGEFVGARPQHAHVVDLQVRTDSVDLLFQAGLFGVRPVGGENAGHVRAMRERGRHVILIVGDAQKGFEQLPVHRAAARQMTLELLRESLQFLRVCAGRGVVRGNRAVRVEEFLDAKKIVSRHHAAAKFSRPVRHTGIVLVGILRILRLEGRMPGIDPGIEHGPANSVGVDVEEAGGRIRLDRHARTPHAGAGGPIRADAPDQSPILRRIGQLPEEAHERGGLVGGGGGVGGAFAFAFNGAGDGNQLFEQAKVAAGTLGTARFAVAGSFDEGADAFADPIVAKRRDRAAPPVRQRHGHAHEFPEGKVRQHHRLVEENPGTLISGVRGTPADLAQVHRLLRLEPFTQGLRGSGRVAAAVRREQQFKALVGRGAVRDPDVG